MCGVVVPLTMAGCAAPAIIPEVEQQQVMALSPGQESRALKFDRIAIRLPRGQVIGRSNMGLACFDMPEEITYEGGRRLLDSELYEDAFREKLLDAGYNVVGDPNALFEDRDADRAELIVGAVIKDVKANICYNSDRIGGDYSRASGEAYMEVEWQVFNQLTRRVVFEKTTQGATQLERAMPNGDNELFILAFTSAADGLLADEQFLDLAIKKTTSSTALLEKPDDVTSVPRVAAPTQDFQSGLTLTRARVATVISGGHGSGFFISDNYLLSNEHVVGGAQLVTVRLVTGRELVGEVVATNSGRDVALIRTEPSGLGGLPIRASDPAIGSRIFVIGSPMDEDLDSTVSAGIVSAFRTMDGLRYIQSDVNVLQGNSGGPMFDEQGNVVAITVLGLFGSGSGLNLFIPINEALSALNVEIVDD